MADRWEVPGPIAGLDGGVVRRLLDAHPAEGWCRACRVAAPCSTRQLAEASDRAPARGPEPG